MRCGSMFFRASVSAGVHSWERGQGGPESWSPLGSPGPRHGAGLGLLRGRRGGAMTLVDAAGCWVTPYNTER